MKNYDHLVFPVEEYQRRLDELRERMKARHLDVVIITEPENITYLTGYQTTGYSYFQSIIVPLEKDAFMITRLLEESNVHARTWVEITRPYTDTGDAIQILHSSLLEFGLVENKNIGYEVNCYFFPHYQQDRFKNTFLGQDLYDCSGIVEEGRIVKSDFEIEIMRKSAIATEAGMKAGVDAVKVGLSENDIAAEVHYAMYKAGGEYPAVAPYITSGPRTNIGHATWEGRQIQANECVFLEIGGCIKRYHTAMMRTVYTGKPPQSLLDGESTVLEAIDVAMDIIREGITVSDLDMAVRSVLDRTKSGGRCITRTGYSIGLAFAPSWDEGQILSIKPGESTYLQKNMTFHFIPWLVGIENDTLMMGISETFRVTEDGVESFFKNTPRQLFIKNE